MTDQVGNGSNPITVLAGVLALQVANGIATGITAFFAKRRAEAQKRRDDENKAKADEAIRLAEENKVKADEAIRLAEVAGKQNVEIIAKQKELHGLVNGDRLVLMRVSMVSADALAAALPTETNIALAVEARRLYGEHKNAVDLELAVKQKELAQ